MAQSRGDRRGGPTAATPPDVAAEDASPGIVGGVRKRYERARTRALSGTAGHVQRRLTEFEIMNRALILAALTLMLFIPALVSLTAVLPLGRDHGLAADFSRHLGLSRTAAADVRHLFNTRDTVRGTTTVVSSLITIIFAYAWPAELGRGYEQIWGLPSRGWRDRWRPLVWLLTFFGVLAAIAASSIGVSGEGGRVLTGLLGLPLVFLWSWWSQHLLLGNRVGWHALVPGAVATAVALCGLGLFVSIYLSASIASNYDRYGPIGVVFVLLSWMLGFSVVMLGGPLAGHAWRQRHDHEAGDADRAAHRMPSPPPM